MKPRAVAGELELVSGVAEEGVAEYVGEFGVHAGILGQAHDPRRPGMSNAVDDAIGQSSLERGRVAEGA